MCCESWHSSVGTDDRVRPCRVPLHTPVQNQPRRSFQGQLGAHQLCFVQNLALTECVLCAEQAALLEAGIKPSGPDSDYDPDATEDEGEDRVEAKVQLHRCLLRIVWLLLAWHPTADRCVGHRSRMQEWLRKRPLCMKLAAVLELLVD